MAEGAGPNELVILVVDDDSSVRDFLRDVLSRKGRTVLTASNGQQALETASSRQLDVILLDMKMPGLGGTETLRRLLEVDAGMVVIILTAYGSIQTAREAMRFGAYDYLTKPVQPRFLEEVIADSLHQKQRTAVSLEQ
jgi:two-component system NtrC family response regulator